MNNLSDILKYTKNMTLLYVEDNQEIRESSLLIFKDLFNDVVIGVDGEDGINKFYEKKIDIVITDIRMPKLNGLEMARKIIKFDDTLPIIINSAHTETEYFTQAIELNVAGYLLKPFSIDNFLKTMITIVEKIKFEQEYNNNITLLEQYQDLMDTNTAVSKTDLKGIITYVNNKFCQLSGYSKEELIGSNHNIVRHKDTSASEYAELWQCIKNEKMQWNGILKNCTKDKKIYYADISIKPILDSDGNILEYISLKKDITLIMSPTKQLYDFVQSSEEAVLILMKTDGFSDIEKFYGYSIAQDININFANTISRWMPKYLNFEKFLALGNGEYAFVQDFKKNSDDFIQSLEEELISLQYAVNNLKIDVGEIEYDISVIISISSGSECIENVHYGIKFLEDSKQDFIIANNFAEKEQDKAENNLKVLKKVKEALEESNIISYFQPIVCNKTQEIVKYESLVRLIDEEGKVISPYFFPRHCKKRKILCQHYKYSFRKFLQSTFYNR
ncbi:MAG: response regulator [Sulfurimonas sp.]|nr:response regulator [Sulfurimonas sp.]